MKDFNKERKSINDLNSSYTERNRVRNPSLAISSSYNNPSSDPYSSPMKDSGFNFGRLVNYTAAS